MGTKLTTEEFKDKIQSLNPNIEVIGDYENARTGILCRCKVCGLEWKPTPDNITRKPRCPRCIGKYRRTDQEFRREISICNPNVEIIGPYINTASHIEVKCRICGYVWSPSAGSLLGGHGCPQCRNMKNSQRLKMDAQVFLDRVKKLQPEIEIIGNYNSSNSKIQCKCNKCGYMWSPSAGSLLNGTGCPRCAGNIKKTHDAFVAELKTVLPNVLVLDQYKNAITKIKCKCLSCGCIWTSKPNNLLNGEGCPVCAQARRIEKSSKKHEVFVNEVKQLTPSIEIQGNYKNAHTKVLCHCIICGHNWNALPMDLVKGTGCPECTHTSTSFMEQSILIALRDALGKDKVHSRDRSTIGMELDVYVPDFGLAVEVGAWSWHKDKVTRDEQKRTLCQKHGIRLITIYDSYPFDTEPFDSNCYVYRQDLGMEKGHKSLRRIVNQLLKDCSVSFEINDGYWKTVEYRAYIKSRRITTQDFIEKLSSINNNVEVLGTYKKSNIGIQTKCKRCGYEWFPTPSHLLQGESCPRCFGHLKKTLEEFKDDLKKRNPTLTVLADNYTNSSTHILVKCNICGHEWESRPNNLFTGYGCPICARKKNAEKSRLTHEKFLERMKQKGNSNVLVLEEYKSAKTKLRCKCKVCGFEWMATPNTLLQGHGCINCYKGK